MIRDLGPGQDRGGGVQGEVDMIRPIIAGNWKMNKTIAEAVAFAEGLKAALKTPSVREVIVAPPFTALQAVAQALRGSAIGLAAQNLHEAPRGAFTGEIAAGMLQEAGCTHVIVGHSERRTLFGETDDRINLKLRAALDASLTPIFCIGELLREREAGETEAVIERQLKGGLNNFTSGDIGHLVIAYEPVWAIGTGKTATKEQAQEAHAFIRKQIKKLYNDRAGETVRIQYGGSVKADNAKELMSQPDVDGVLVGGASLKADDFVGIINGAIEAMKAGK